MSKPDHSAIPLQPASSTTPILPPPESPDTHSMGDSARPVFSSQYGGYGSQNYDDDDKDPLLSSSTGSAGGGPGARRRRNSVDADSKGGCLSVLVPVVAIIALLLLLSRMSIIPAPSTNLLTNQLSPFLPAGFLAFLGGTGVGPKSPHPIIPLISQANDKWSNVLSSQSTTFDRATKTYKSRYGIPPPPGFDKWFAFAIQGRNHTLVDEYDQLMADLLPYRSLSPSEIRRRTQELAQVPGISIVSIRNGAAQVHSKSGKWAPALAFQQMIGTFVRDLPDMDIAINEKPEGRVLPRRQRTVLMEDYGLEGDELAPNMTDPMIRPTIEGFKPEWQRDGSVWDAFRRSCPTTSPSRRLVETVRSAEAGGASILQVQGRASSKTDAPTTRRKNTNQSYPPTRELTFSHDLDSSTDICANPSMHSLHSAFFSDQRTIEHLYPVFSPSKPPGYADILIPSHHYWAPSSEFTYEWEMMKGRTREPTDLDWGVKKSTIYWRGKVTRGADTPPGRAPSFQKQRLVKMANEAHTTNRVLVAFDPKTAGLISAAVPTNEVNKATADVAMACDPNLGECSYLRSLGYRVEPPGPLSEAWKHKYVLDVDEIGFSPRFLALMESKSAVVKSSVQKEFWSGWAIPWKHFIPLSPSYAELYNIQTFFSGFPSSFTSNSSYTKTVLTKPHPIPILPTTSDGEPFAGDRALRDIAEAGREWRQQHVRKADMECYVYRLMVEWAALTTEAEE
ncbi:capsular associated protein [Meredithblackwellia eburnea MCA 4105]